MRLRQSKLAVMLILSMLATMFVGVSTVAAAELSIVGSADVVRNDDTFQKLATVQIDLPVLEGEGTRSDGKTKAHVVLVSLPDNFAIDFSDSGMLRDSKKNPRGLAQSCPEVTIVKNKQGSGNITLPAGTQGAKNAGIERISDREFKLHLAVDANDSDVRVLLTFPGVLVPSRFSGPIPVQFTNVSGAFDKKTTIELNEASSAAASVDASVFATVDVAKDKIGRVGINLQENTSSAFALGKTMVLKLPDGLVWEKPAISSLVSSICNLKATIEPGDATRLVVQRILTGSPKSVYRLEADIKVVKEKELTPGSVSAAVLGDANVKQESLVLGTFSDYSGGKGVQVSVQGNAPDIPAGKLNQTTAEINIESKIANALLNDVDIKISLPEQAKFYNINVYADNGISITSRKFTDNGQTLLLRIKSNGSVLGRIKLQSLQVMTAADFRGPLKVKVEGAGIKEQEVTIAEVYGIKGEMEAVKSVAAGKQEQQISAIRIEETVPGTLDKGSLLLELPQGVTWSKHPTVSVIKGDVDVNTEGVVAHGQLLTVPIRTSSVSPSIVKISGVLLNLDRMVPAGDIKVRVFGDAVDEVNNQPAKKSVGNTEGVATDSNGALFAKHTAALTLTIARNGSALPNAAGASFVIGEKTYTKNGEVREMDVAPYIKNDRTYMPVRYIANALGITDENIQWDEAAQLVTLQHMGKIVKLTIGVASVDVDGVVTAIDVAPEITDSRTMLPARFVAEAFGYNVGWNADTRTVTLSANANVILP